MELGYIVGIHKWVESLTLFSEKAENAIKGERTMQQWLNVGEVTDKKKTIVWDVQSRKSKGKEQEGGGGFRKK